MKYLLSGVESERLLFRKIRKSDYNDWLPFHKDDYATKYWNAPIQEPDQACQNWYKYQFNRYEAGLGGLNALVEKSSGSLVGHCGLLVQTVDDIIELEIGYALLPNFRNFGYATEAAKKCMNFAFENNLSESLISIINIANSPSAHVAMKNGMSIEKRTTYKENDVNIWRIQKNEWTIQRKSQ